MPAHPARWRQRRTARPVPCRVSPPPAPNCATPSLQSFSVSRRPWRPAASIGVETCCHGAQSGEQSLLQCGNPRNVGSGHRQPIEGCAIGRHQMTLGGLIIFLLIGAVAGWLAGRIMRGGFGLVGDIVVGVIGAEIGGWLFGLLGIAVGGLIGSIIAATVGAIILIAVIRLIRRA